MLELKNLNSQLAELKLEFDAAIVNGNSFAEVKKIYTRIKELERRIVEHQLELLKSGRNED